MTTKPCKNGHAAEHRYKPKNLNYLVCRLCVKIRDKRQRDKLKLLDPEKLKTKARANNLRHFFNLEIADYDRMLDAQAGRCAICQQPETSVKRGQLERLAVDHNHKTGKIRELLCAKCNKAIGLFLENTDVMLRAISYLKRHNFE